MGVESLKANFTAGELDPKLHSRTDISKFQSGVAEAENMVIMSQGGLRRRAGLSIIQDEEVASHSRIIPFVFNTEQKYIVLMRDNAIDIYKDGVKVASNIITTFTEAELYEVDFVQSADTMIFAHENHYPKQLQRQGDDATWAFGDIVFDYEPYDNSIITSYTNDGTTETVSVAIGEVILNVDGNDSNGLDNHLYKAKLPRSDINLATENFSSTTNWEDLGERGKAWSASNGYPRTCTFFGGRLYFAGSTSKPTTVWGSKINGFFDFDLGTGQDDYGISDILDTDQYNPIVNIFAGRDLIVFTTGGELHNTATPITPSTSSWKRQTGYGSKNIRPILIDGSVLFIDSSGRNVRRFLYDYTEDGYTSQSISLLSAHMINNVVAMDSIKGTEYDVSDFVYVVNGDGTVAVLNTMRSEEIAGWTRWTTQGEFIDVCVLEKEVYFLIKRKGNYYIEKLTENTYTDHNVIQDGAEPSTLNVIHNEDDVTSSIYNVVYTDYTTGVGTNTLQTNFSNAMMSQYFKVIADYSIQADQVPIGTAGNNSITIGRDAYRLEVGLNYNTKVTTLPIATETQKGTTLHRRKRVVKVDVNVLESLGVYVRDKFKSDREFTVVLDQAPELFTGFKEYYLLGYDRLAEIEVSQKEPLPFTLRSIGFEIEY